MTGQGIIDWVSLFANSSYLLLAIWGLWCFFPPLRSRNELGASYYLMVAIWLGFLGIALNVFYWRVFGDIVVYYNLMDLTTLRYYGSIGDFVWKTLSGVSIFMHFYARWASLPEDERGDWPILLVSYYPDRGHWLYRYHSVFNRNKDKDLKS